MMAYDDLLTMAAWGEKRIRKLLLSWYEYNTNTRYECTYSNCKMKYLLVLDFLRLVYMCVVVEWRVVVKKKGGPTTEEKATVLQLSLEVDPFKNEINYCSVCVNSWTAFNDCADDEHD